jgi:GH43 family beta-xylosidase
MELVALAAAAALAFHNPLVLQRADPQVALHSDGYYYFTATVPEYDRIELRRVKDLNEPARRRPGRCGASMPAAS